MRLVLTAHILAGSIGLITGFTALFVVKGAKLHRRVGLAFVYSMLAMAIAGGTMAIVKNVGVKVNVPSAVLTAYLVLTSLVAVRAPNERTRLFTIAAMLAVIPVAAFDFIIAADLLADEKNRGFAAPFFAFGVLGVLAIAGDIRVIRFGPLTGSRRIARHLWRMCFALLIASLSFFIGQAKVIPEPIRIMPLLAMPMLIVAVMMIYWMWRVRLRQTLRGLTLKSVEAA
jgi:peptidoglycan/LPS O-acetylase OafA/YrhL